MKRFYALIIALIMLFAFCGCNGGSSAVDPSDPNQSDIVGDEISWGTLADTDITGAWKLADGEHPEYYIFTTDCKIRVSSGSSRIESSIQYGKDANGTRYAYSQGQHLYGQWTYKLNDDRLSITYPADDNGDVLSYELVRADYSQVNLKADENPTIADELVGYWYNEEYCDSYTFTDDGYAYYSLTDDDDSNADIFIYKAFVNYTYNATEDTVSFTYIDSDLEPVTIDSAYVIDGDTLTIDGCEYFRTDPSANNQ